MPANLNALIRYKTINLCLYGGVRRWTIGELIDACSGALAEARGRYARVSERTIRDDIRVMRSDILGFNAPISQEKGLYYYSDPHYSILSLSLTDSDLVLKIFRLLLDIREDVKHPELENILNKLVKITGITIPEAHAGKKAVPDEAMEHGIPMQHMVITNKSIGHPYRELGARPAKKRFYRLEIPEQGKLDDTFSGDKGEESVTWGEVLSLIR